MAIEADSFDDAAIRRELRNLVEHSRKALAEELGRVRRELAKISNSGGKVSELDDKLAEGNRYWDQMLDYIDVSRRPQA